MLLMPWTFTAAHATTDGAAFGFAFYPHVTFSQVVRFDTGPAGSGVAPLGLLAAAALALLLTNGTRLRWAARAWMLTLLAWAAVVVPARLAPGTAVPAPEGVLSLGALGVAVAGGLAVSSLRQRRWGWRRVAAVAATAGVALGGIGFAADAIDGRWQAPSTSWPSELAFTRDQQFQGQFRILWVGDPAVLPLDPARVSTGLSYTLTRNGPGDARELLRAPRTTTRDPVADAVTAAVAGRTSRLGRIVAPMGVRYVAVPLRSGPGGAAGRTPAALDAALRDQLDLARLGSDSALELYENQAWYPGRTVVHGRHSTIPAQPRDPAQAAANSDLSGSRPLGDQPSAPGTVLWFEADDAGWHATAAGHALAHRPAFGITNQFRLDTRAAVTITHDGQGTRYLLIGAEVILWVLALLWWSRGRRRGRSADREAARAAARAARAERRRGDDDGLESTVEFWESG